MGFTEEVFLFLFLPGSIILYLLFLKTKREITDGIILGLSIAFYCWSGLNTLLVFLLIVLITCLFGEVVFSVSKYRRETVGCNEKGKLWLRVSVVSILIPLFCYKYLQVIINTLSSISGTHFSLIKMAVPLGISFIIFEAISYIVDIYRGYATPGNVFDVLLFISFFPKLISGPIVLWRDFQPQISNRVFHIEQIAHGIERIIIGYAEKTIIADTLGAQILKIDSQIISQRGIDTYTAWLKAFMFFFQVYYDFSGYSQIALGLSEVFGFSFEENFHFPYMATSVTDFWRRWHISLGRWFREYVYIPLGGNRTGNVYLHLFVVFLLTGIWHGANWTFLLWGIGHGLLVIWERSVKDKEWYKCIPRIIKWVCTMTCVCCLWILFGAENLESAGHFFYSLFMSPGKMPLNFTWRYFLTTKILLVLIIAVIGSAAEIFADSKMFKKLKTSNEGLVIKRSALIILFGLVILFVVNSTYSPFMYFQF